MIRFLLPHIALPLLLLSAVPPAFPQAAKPVTGAPVKKLVQGGHKMEITLERFDLGTWHAIDPSLVLSDGDRLRFRYRTDFDGYLYVTNQTSSGTYEQLFPLAETGQDNRIVSGKEYTVPSTAADFKVAGPAGYEVVYFLVTPSKMAAGPPRTTPVPPDFKMQSAEADSALRRYDLAVARGLHRSCRRSHAGSARIGVAAYAGGRG